MAKKILQSGLHPAFEIGISYSEIFLRAGMVEVLAAVKKLLKGVKIHEEIADRKVPVQGEPYCVITYQDNEWTRISGDLCHSALDWETVRQLSAALETTGVFWSFEDTSCAFDWKVYEKGKLVEEVQLMPGEPARAKSKLRDLKPLKVKDEKAWFSRSFKQMGIYVHPGLAWDLEQGNLLLDKTALRGCRGAEVRLLDVKARN